MSDEVTLPPRILPGASMDEVIKTLQAYHDYIQAREPTTAGGQLEKFMTYQTAVKVGLLSFTAGGYASGPSGGYVVPGILTSNPADATPPTPIAGLTVSGSVAHYLVEITAPTYLQGGGNGRTIIYGANYSGSGPLPTFADASERGTIPGRGTMLVVATEPGVATYFWAKAETRHPTLQATPTGGTNGVTATAELIEDQHVLNLSAAKLTAGSIGVSEYIQSTGYTGSGSGEWRIDGSGVARFSGVIVSGTVYATAGEFGGVTINGALTMNSSGHIKGGQTAYNTGTGFFLGYSGAAYKFSIGTSSLGVTWDGSAFTVNGEVVLSANMPAETVTSSNGGESVYETLTTTETELIDLGTFDTTVSGVANPIYIHIGFDGQIIADTSGATNAVYRVKVDGVTEKTYTFTAVASTTKDFTKSEPILVASPPTGSFDVTVTGQLTGSTGGPADAAFSVVIFALGLKR